MKKLLLILLTSCAAKNAKVEKLSEEKIPDFHLEEIDLEDLPEAGEKDEEEEETP